MAQGRWRTLGGPSMGFHWGLHYYANFFFLELECVGVNGWVPLDVEVWICARASVINGNGSHRGGTLQFIKRFPTIIPLNPHEAL